MFCQPHYTASCLISVQPQITCRPTDPISAAQLGDRLFPLRRSQHKLHSLIHDTLSSPRHLQLLLAPQTTSSTVKDVMISICKGCHGNEHSVAAPLYRS